MDSVIIKCLYLSLISPTHNRLKLTSFILFISFIVLHAHPGPEPVIHFLRAHPQVDKVMKEEYTV